MTPARTASPPIKIGQRLRRQILAKHAPHLLNRPKPLTPAARSRREKIRWLESVASEKGEGCRDWPWAATSHGYGTIRWDGKGVKVGHVILDLSGRERPAGMIMLHSCDRPSCAAPWHLRWGTYADNAADRAERQPGVMATAIALRDGSA